HRFPIRRRLPRAPSAASKLATPDHVLSRAILCSKSSRTMPWHYPKKRLALVGEESVSGGTGGSRCRVNQEHPLMRIYIIGNDGIRLCRERPTAVGEGEIAIASIAELHAAPLSGKQL